MRTMDFESAERAVRERLSDGRYRHSIAVSECAEKLAALYGADPEKARFAGLVHDICKDDGKDLLLQTAEEFGIIFTESEKANPKLWHAVVGAAYVWENFTKDAEIVSAVRYHTTGRAGMSLLEKIIYVADCVSDDREYPDAAAMRELAFTDLDRVIYEMTRQTLQKLLKTGRMLHADTIGAYNQFCPGRREKQETEGNSQ